MENRFSSSFLVARKKEEGAVLQIIKTEQPQPLNMIKLVDLSPEVVCHLFSFLQAKDLFILECTSKRLGDICSANASIIWKQAFYNFYRAKNNVPSIPSFTTTPKWRTLCKTVLQSDLWRTRCTTVITDTDAFRSKRNKEVFRTSIKMNPSGSLLTTIRSQHSVAFMQEYTLELSDKSLVVKPAEKWLITECNQNGSDWRSHVLVNDVQVATALSKQTFVTVHRNSMKVWYPVYGRASWSTHKQGIEYPGSSKKGSENAAVIASSTELKIGNNFIVQNMNHVAVVNEPELEVWNVTSKPAKRVASVPFSWVCASERSILLLPKKLIIPALTEGEPDFEVVAYELDASGRELWRTKIMDTGKLNCVCSNSQYVCYGTQKGAIVVIKIQDGSIVTTLQNPTAGIALIDMSDEIIASVGGSNSMIQIWDIATGNLLHSIPQGWKWVEMKLHKMNNVAAFLVCWSRTGVLNVIDPYSGAVIISKENAAHPEIFCMEVTNNMILGITIDGFLIANAIRPYKKKAPTKATSAPQSSSSQVQKHKTTTVVLPNTKTPNSWSRQDKNFTETVEDWDDAYDDDDYDDDYY